MFLIPAVATAIAHPKDVLTGYRVGVGDAALCTICHTELGDGDAVSVYAYRLADSPLWDVPRLYCELCVPAEIETPTLAATEVLASATLGAVIEPVERTARLCLTGVELLSYSGPDEGAKP